MEEITKKWRRKVKGIFLLFCVFAVGLLGTFLTKDELIINMGIGALKGMRSFCIVGMAVTGLWGGLAGVTMANRLRKQEISAQKRQALAQAEEKKHTANLSVKGKLENAQLRTLLQEKQQNEWVHFSQMIGQIIAQLAQMDNYQERLSRLLASNDVQTLSDTEEVLDRVEQYICRNVRKVLNYMEVIDPKGKQDVELLQTKLDACLADNQEQLRQSQEFILALTDFINRQGDSENDLSMLEVYKNTILDSIQDA